MKYFTRPWKCEKCGRRYSYQAFFRLTKPDMYMHCKCGYIFSRDCWGLVDYVQLDIQELGSVGFKISTVYLEVVFEDDEQYETIIFPDNEKVNLFYQERCRTRNEAVKGHKLAVELVLSSNFLVVVMEGIIDGREVSLSNSW